MDSINGDKVNGFCVIGGGEVGGIGWGNYGTSANSSSHATSSWRLKEFTEGAVTIGVGSRFQYFTTRIKKDGFLQRHQLGPCRTLKG